MYLLLITHADDGRVLGSWRALCAYLVHFMRVTLLVSFLYAVRVPDGVGDEAEAPFSLAGTRPRS